TLIVMLVGQDGLDASPELRGEHGLGLQGVEVVRVEEVHLVEAVERLDARRINAGLLDQLAQRPVDDRLAVLQASRDRLPKPWKQSTRRAFEQEELQTVGV